MNNAPIEWDIILHWSDQPPIKSILMTAKQFKAALIAQWRSSQHYQWHQELKSSKRANFATQEDEDLLHSPFEDDPEGAFYYSSEDVEGGNSTSAAFNVGKHPGGHSSRPQH
jgi:hypothetical protein